MNPRIHQIRRLKGSLEGLNVTTSHQGKNRPSHQRRFTRGDGVRLPDGREGVVQSWDGAPVEGYKVWVKPTDGGDWFWAAEKDLVSVPALNTGKYGGPQRGGAPGGWVGGNHYRQRG